MKRVLHVVTLLLAASGAACGPPTVKPVAAPDAEVACPGGGRQWSLEVLDRRAERENSEKLESLLRDSITKSFPGCEWARGEGAAGSKVTIEVHRFGVRQESGYGSSWEAAADWSVLARDASGRTLTEFESNAEISRPNYRGLDNEKEALNQAFRQALDRTLAGLRAVSPAG